MVDEAILTESESEDFMNEDHGHHHGHHGKDHGKGGKHGKGGCCKCKGAFAQAGILGVLLLVHVMFLRKLFIAQTELERVSPEKKGWGGCGKWKGKCGDGKWKNWKGKCGEKNTTPVQQEAQPQPAQPQVV